MGRGSQFRTMASFLGLVFFALVLTPSEVQAWTRARVHSARANVEVGDDASMQVRLILDLQVEAGWVHELELAGLEEGLELDARRRPYLRSEEGEILRPEFEADADGKIRMTFERRDSPRRGEYHVILHYRIPANPKALEVVAPGRARVTWTLPGWETGLHNVTVTMNAPAGSNLPEALADPPPGIEVQAQKTTRGTVLTWKRTHLPRMTPWPLSVDVPLTASQAPAEQNESADTPPPPGFRPLNLHESTPLPWYLLLLALLALTKRASIHARAGAQSLWPGWRWPAILGATAVMVAAGFWLRPQAPLFAIVLLGFGLQLPRRPSSGWLARDWRASAAAVSQRRSWTRPDLLDGSTLPGVLVLGGCVGLLASLDQAVGALLLLPCFFTGTRLHNAPSARECESILHGFARRLALPDDAPGIGFAWERCEEGYPRIRMHLCSARTGLLSLSLAVVTAQEGFLLRRRVAVVCETRAQTEADDMLRTLLASVPHTRGPAGRIIRVLSWEPETIQVLRALSGSRTSRKPRAARSPSIMRKVLPGRSRKVA